MFMTSRSAVLEAKTSESPRVSETMQRTPSDHAGTKLMSSIVYGRPEWNQVMSVKELCKLFLKFVELAALKSCDL